MQKGFVFTKLADRMASIAELSDGDLELLAAMPFTISHFASHDQLLRKSDQPSHCRLVLQGYLCWKDGNDGQITSIYVPGDIPDLHTMIAPKLDAHLTALGPAVVAAVPHAFFQEISSRSPNLDHALQLLGLADTACLRNWIINLGSRDSLTRVAHLICEITTRLRAVGLATDDRFPSPFTQSDLASACAISAVHANRIIQELRRRQVLMWQSRTITISDWQALCRIACFEPDYLGLRSLGASARHRSQPISLAEVSELSILR
ncbi:MAG: putative Transcriptional regulator, Crp/Fnr family [Bradyrhizobium sp.]|nr:putative Transcriptional regulator, Crp/Fnr family [Bradyrhizobium sp.]